MAGGGGAVHGGGGRGSGGLWFPREGRESRGGQQVEQGRERPHRGGGSLSTGGHGKGARRLASARHGAQGIPCGDREGES